MAMRPAWEHTSGPLAIKKPAAAAAEAQVAPAPPPSVDDTAATEALPAVTEARISELEADELLPSDLVTDPIHPPGPPAQAAPAQATSVPPPAPHPSSVPPPAPRVAPSQPPVRPSVPAPRAAISSPSLSDALPAIRPSRKPLWIGLGVAAVVGVGLVFAFRSGSEETTATPAASATVSPPAASAATTADIPPVPEATETARTESVPAKPTTVAAEAPPAATEAPTHAAPATPVHTARPSAIAPPKSAPRHPHPAAKSGSGSKGTGGIVRDVPF